MGLSGPPPKHPSARARVNKASTRAVLTEPDPETVEIPDLPLRLDYDKQEIPWDDHAVDWWVAIWSSPMSAEFHKSDIHGLYRLADLVDAYWAGRGDTLKLAAEIRQTQKDYGLTPLDRRRLEWSIESAERARDEGDRRRATKSQKARAEGADDPRLTLVQQTGA